MGGSFALALQQRGLAGEVWGWSRSRRARAFARRNQVGHRVWDRPTQAAAGADLVVIAVPVKQMPVLAQQVAPVLAPGALITDMGSTKAVVQREILRTLPAHLTFIGGHPMCGSEKQGVYHARPDLYQDALYLLTPPKQPVKGLARLRKLIRSIGATPLSLSPEEHDELVALISHLPHLVATCLVLAIAEHPRKQMLMRLAATGFRDATRVAQGPENIWVDIFATNRKQVSSSLRRLLPILRKADAALRSDEEALRTMLQKARKLRESL